MEQQKNGSIFGLIGGLILLGLSNLIVPAILIGSIFALIRCAVTA